MAEMISSQRYSVNVFAEGCQKKVLKLLKKRPFAFIAEKDAKKELLKGVSVKLKNSF